MGNREEIFWADREFPSDFLDQKAIDLYVSLIRKGGKINHSHEGLTLKAVLTGLEMNKVAYRLTAQPGVGYLVEGIENNTKVQWYSFLKESFKNGS